MVFCQTLPWLCLHSAYAGGLRTPGFDSCLPQTSSALASSCYLNDKNSELLSANSPLINFPFCTWQQPTYLATLFSTPLVPRPCSVSLSLRSVLTCPIWAHLLHSLLSHLFNTSLFATLAFTNQSLLPKTPKLFLALSSDFGVIILATCYYLLSVCIPFGFLTNWKVFFDRCFPGGEGDGRCRTINWNTAKILLKFPLNLIQWKLQFLE